MSFKEQIAPYLAPLESQIRRIDGDSKVPLFYEPIDYVCRFPGKRIRPLLVIFTAMMHGEAAETAYKPAVAVELLHNFTLVHDDIMDDDDTRRGQPTVHKKWDLGTAILAGDGLMGLAFKKLLESEKGDLVRMVQRFTETMIVICEGQGLDKMFETGSAVTVDSYLDMIGRKTAVLIELSCELGAMISNAGEEHISDMREMGYALGMGFQIQDDILDIFADAGQLGKKTGSDLVRHKQTILTLKLEEKTGNEDFYALSLSRFKAVLDESGALEEATQLVQKHLNHAENIMKRFPENEGKKMLYLLLDFLKNRQY